MKVKICGIKFEENLKEVSSLRPDYLGFIFYPKSPRFMVETLSPSILSLIPESIIKTGVFVNAELEFVNSKVKQYGLKAVQIHGEERPEYLKELRTILGKGFQIIKAFGIDRNFDFGLLETYTPWVDLFLFDTKSPLKGGTGLLFDWNILKDYHENKPFFLSGGIGIEELKEIESWETGIPSYQKLYGLDLNSKLEISPGLKDVAKVENAIQLIKKNK